MSGAVDLEERLNAICRPNEAGCHLVGTGTGADGYGKTRVHGRFIYTHRIAYELYKGKIPEGLEIDHLCRVRNCMNPLHLEAVPRSVNTKRGVLAEVTRKRMNKPYCKSGHPFSGDNLFVNKKGHRRCRACGRFAMRERRAALNLKRKVDE